MIERNATKRENLAVKARKRGRGTLGVSDVKTRCVSEIQSSLRVASSGGPKRTERMGNIQGTKKMGIGG